MRAHLFLLPVVLAGCSSTIGSFSSYSVSQREVLKRSQAEIDRREPWSGSAAILIKNADDYSRTTWVVRAGALDYSACYPVYKGIYLVPGTERELRFSRDGCLTGYKILRGPCAAAITSDSGEVLMVPAK